jgi:hypothetical protein
MHTISELYELTKNPRINEVSLKLLADYYSTYLTPFEYRFFTEDDTYIAVRFPPEAFCHLVGMEFVAQKAVNRAEIYKYKGLDGFNNVNSGVISFDTLKKLNKGRFKSVKDKYVFFYLIPKVFNNKNAVQYRSEGDSSILSDIIFYDNILNAYVHVGVVKNVDGVYVPRTFFVERVTASNDGLKFVENQIKLDIKKIETIKTADV